jgi:hypothetical protein
MDEKCDHKITWKDDCGAVVVATNPNRSFRQYIAEQMVLAAHKEFAEFAQEVNVALRRIKPGETVTLQSRPIVVTIEAPPEPQTAPPAP